MPLAPARSPAPGRRASAAEALLVVFALHYLLISQKLMITDYRSPPLFGVEGARRG